MKQIQEFESGIHNRPDGRTEVIFENGTSSNMMYQSLYKALHFNGKAITENSDNVTEEFYESFTQITEVDQEAGYIYVLSSKSTDPKISEISNLFKIGYATTLVANRIKNAEKEPTYLMAGVKIVAEYKAFNMNPQKFELLLHNFFGNSCLDIDVFDEKNKRHVPREWFIVPIDIIDSAIQLIITGEIIQYKYDAKNKMLVKR